MMTKQEAFDTAARGVIAQGGPSRGLDAREEYTAHDAAKWMRYAYLCECGYWHLSKTPANMSGPEKAKAPAALGDEFETIDPLMQ
jgi:hypothetical protein